MDCAHCGTTQRPGASFCRNCGGSLDGEAPPPASSVVPAKRQLVVALAGYFALLAVSLVIVTTNALAVDEQRVLDGMLIVVALGAMQWVSGSCDEVPSLRRFLAPPRNLPPRLVGVLLGGLVLAFVAASILAMMVPMIDEDVMAAYRASGEGIGYALADLSLLTPLLEETLFRGLILGTLIGTVGRKSALWASSLMFATAHLTPLSFVHHTLLGLICGHARLETKSLLVPMLLHGLYNAAVVVDSW
ncbi:MAG: CPBP family intramembrane metalloprotease [Myxococcales bacterium]|nr:CPBP family intramembrane metalloprotease [Myxococcales bacterium]